VSGDLDLRSSHTSRRRSSQSLAATRAFLHCNPASLRQCGGGYVGSPLEADE